MIYRMKQKLFSWGDDFVIQDDSGQDRFFVDGKAFSLGNQLSFQDMQGNELAYIRQRLLSFAPTYEISRSGQVLATVSKELFTFFSCTFDIDLPGPNDLQAKGDFLDHQYAFERGGETVARVSKEWFAVADTYGVQVEPGEDDVLILASSVVIDMACHGDRKD
ncbi:MAG TPA: LURP-one-related family protein [Candidatus Angelobacter sp.]|nr:LURP-one-related family protein [Candidatus Angelobacter sp.]